jgi:hypothetical protein
MWKLDPIFARRIQDLVSTWQRKVMKTGIANKARRLHMLNHLHSLQRQIIEERSAKATQAAKERQGQNVFPGGETGLLNDRDGLFDHALSREIRATLDQAAKEMGHSVAKCEVYSEMDDKPVQLSIARIDEIVARVNADRATPSQPSK